MIRTIVPIVGFVALAGSTADAALLPYRFDKVSETGAAYSTLGLPALNDNGVAAFGAELAGGGSRIYFGNQFGVQPVPLVPGVGYYSPVDINNPGQVTFYGTVAPPAGQTFGDSVVYRADPTGITTIGRALGVIEESMNGGPVINNAGQVAFATYATIQSRLLVGDGSGEPQSRANSAGVLGGPRLNNAGKVAYGAGGQFVGQYLLYENQTVAANPSFGQPTVFTDPDYGTSGPFTSLHTIDVGDNDRVVFSARWNNVTDAFYLWENGTLSKVAGTNGLTGIPAINDNGVVAGLVSGNGPTRLSIFQGGVEGTIAYVGMPFFGSTITDLGFSPEGFNNTNDVAFLATLADGRTVSVISELPEPGAVSMLIGCGALMLRRRSKVYRTLGGVTS
jgi:hypothetical protein